MSTGATFNFDDISIYMHSDGYPEGAAKALRDALEYSWEWPRFEMSDFAAAFIAANKPKGGGHIYLESSYCDYEYNITYEDGEVMIEFDDYDKSNLHEFFKEFIND